VDKVRSENRNVLLLSGGDMFSGNPIVDKYQEKGSPMVELMNKIGYQYAPFGNHEFDYGQEILAKRIEQANFQMLCANIKIDKESPIKKPEPYVTFDLDGIAVCLLSTIQVGNSNGKLIPSTHPDKVLGIDFFQPVEAHEEYKYLRKKCDLFVSLNHNGVDADFILANKMPELDVIVGGHSHTRIDTGMLVNGVLITQAECHLKYIGKTTITFEGKKIISKKNELINVAELTDENEEIKLMIAEYYEKSPLKEVVGAASEDFEGKENLGGLMTDAITAIHNLDIAFQNSGGIRVNKIEKGNITLAQIYELDPFDNEVVAFEMSYDELYSLIKNSHRGGRKNADLMVSGITYTIKMKNDKVEDIKMFTLDGKLLDKNKMYKVGMNSYISSSYKFDHKDAGKSLYMTSAETLEEYLKQQKEVKPSADRTKVE
jgi:5''-nucleotidase/2'',3''-cyclic phosphodiesterase and related esterases